MSSATIPLAVQPPPINNPLDTYSKLLSLRTMQQQNAQRQQLFPEQLQAAQLENEQRELANQQHVRMLKSQEMLQKAYMDAGGDLNKTSQLARQYGVLPNDVMNLEKMRREAAEKDAKIEKDQRDVMMKNSDAIVGRVDAFLRDNNEEEQGKLYPQLLDGFLRDKLLKPDEVSQILQHYPEYPGKQVMQQFRNLHTTNSINLKDADLVAKQASTAASQSTTKKNNLTIASKTVPDDPDAYAAWYQQQPADIQAKVPAEYSPEAVKRIKSWQLNPLQQAEVPGKQAQSQQEQRESDSAQLSAAAQVGKDAYAEAWYRLDPDRRKVFPHPDTYGKNTPELVRQFGMKPAQQQTAQHQQNMEDIALGNQAISRGRLSVEQANSRRQQQQFDVTYGSLVTPDGRPMDPEAAKAVASQDPLANAIANYQVAPPAATTRGGAPNPTMRKVLYINPGYDVKNWEGQKKMYNAYTSGQQSKEIGGIVTALGHVGTLGHAIDALNNGNVPLLNQIANSLSVATGGDAVTTFRAIVHKVAPEINRAYVGGVGAQGEILAQESDFDPKLGDRQLRSNAGITVKLLRSKIGSLENQWKTTMGRDDFGDRFLTPEAKEALDKFSPQQAPAAGAPKSGSAAAPAPQFKEDQTVTMKDGSKRVVSKVYPNGKFDLYDKTFPRAHLHGYAQHNNMTDEQATKALKNMGYGIVD